MSRPKSSERLDLKDVRETIDFAGNFRIHLLNSRSNGTTTARLWHHDGHVIGRARGYGYSRQGAALGEAITTLFADRLQDLSPVGALIERNGVKYLEGAAGEESVLEVIRALGFVDAKIFRTGERSSMLLARVKGGAL